MLTPRCSARTAALIVRADGHTLLISNALDTDAWVDDRVAYEPHLAGTRNPDRQRQMAALIALVRAGERFARIGWQQEGATTSSSPPSPTPPIPMPGFRSMTTLSI